LQMADAFKAAAVTRNEYRLALGLDEIPGSDVFLVPFTLAEIPAGQIGSVQVIEGEAEEVPALPSGEDEQPTAPKALPRKARGFTLDAKKQLWKAHDTNATAWEPAFRRAARRAFRDDLERIRDIVNSYKAINWQSIEDEVRMYLLAESGDNWRAQFLPVMSGVIEAAGDTWATALGMQFDVENLLAQAWFDEYTLKFAQEINKTTLDGLAVMFQQAQAEGWSIPDMQGHITELFEQWMKGDKMSEDFEWYEDRLPPHRTAMISRTETIRSSNAGTVELFREWNVQMMEWLSTPDNRTREAHRIGSMWGFPPVIAPVGGTFDVGGERLRYPGDPNGSPGNTIQCRCTTAAYFGSEE
jgi:hypothetical protein